MTTEPAECAARPVPNCALNSFKLLPPTPTSRTLHISSSILTRSAAANDVIPVTAVIWANTMSLLKAVVTAVPAIGDCITLSIDIIALEF